MRIVRGVVVLAAVMALGCGSESTTESAGGADVTTGGEDTATTGGVQDTGAATGGVEDTGATGGVEDTGATTGGVEDTGATTGGDEDTKLPVNYDGLLGSPCSGDEDCDGDTFCAFSFCTEFCRDVDNGFEPIPDTCQTQSSTTDLPAMGCPTDLSICMPGLAGAGAVCDLNADCPGGFTCGGLIGSGGLLASGACLPYAQRKKTGEPCLLGDDCGSSFCLGADEAAGTEGTCADRCKNNKNCADGQLCQALEVPPSADDPEAPPVSDTFIALCVGAPGSLKYCFKQSACPDGEICAASIEPSSLIAQYFCVTGNAGGAAVGAACETAADCLSGACLLAGLAEEGGPAKGYCAANCQKDPADCADGMHCAQVSLHDNGTEDPSDNKTFGQCLFGAPGDFCGMGVDAWCAEKNSACEPGEGMGQDLGTCSEPPTGCAGAGCSDGLSCTQDICDDTSGQCDFSQLTVDTCLIDGVCYAAGDTDAANACLMCDPAQDTGAWSPAASGAACDDGVACNDSACDGAGGCAGVAKDCSDGLACTDDSCEVATGTCVNTLTANHCLIDGVCAADGDKDAANDCQACDSATATGAWTPLPDGTTCAGPGICTAGQCVAL